MSDIRKIIRVFLASPGDLQDERRAAKAVIDEFNKLWADAMGYHVELIGWEDTISQYGRPQGIINQDLERCELVIGMMWKRWGSPPSKDGKFSSGFQEEFETSIASRRTKGRPEMALFFKEIDKELLRDPGEELKKVLNFKDKIIEEKEIFFEPFGGISEFEGKVRSCVTAYIQKLHAAESEKIASETQATPAVVDTDAKPRAATTPLSPQGAVFLREFIASTELESGEKYSAVDVARFRLLASAVTTSANDDETIGAHDSNLLYRNRNLLDLGDREKRALLKAGINHYSSENVPLWSWYRAVDGFSRRLFSFYTMFEATQREVGAFRAMRLIEEPLSISKDFNREFFLDNWFASDASGAKKVAALGYLSDCGLVEDLPYIKREFDRGDYQTRSEAAGAIIRINFRQGRMQAILALYELQPDVIEKNLVEQIFGNGDVISDETLSKGLSHRSAAVRQISLRFLKERGSIDAVEADRLLGDSDEDVRYEAITSLIALGRAFTDEQAKNVLVRRSSGGVLGFSGISTGEAVWNKFQQDHLAQKSDEELERLAAAGPVFDRNAELALFDRHFKLRKHALELLVRDRFQTNFEEKLAAMAARYGSDSQLVKDTRGLKNHLTKGFTRNALDIFCKKGGPKDLTIVREALKSEFVGYSNLDVDYLRRHGEWQDIPLIVATVSRGEYGTSLLSEDYSVKYQTAARAIYAMAKDRLPELLNMAMPNPLTTGILVEASDASFRGLSDALLQFLLHSEDDSVRKICALRIIKALPKSRIASILDDYMSGDKQRYYNVMHWLDLGISATKEIGQRAAEKAIRENWSRKILRRSRGR